MYSKREKKIASSTTVGTSSMSTSTPHAAAIFNFTDDVSSINSLVRKNDEDKPKKKKRIIDMVYEAISAVGNGTKGASYVAIKEWMRANNADLTESRLKTSLKLALLKALEDGTLVRPLASKNLVGLRGSFALPKKIPPKVAKQKAVRKVTSKGPNAYVSDSEITINKGSKKAKKRNLSDTEIDARKLKVKVAPTKSKSKPKKLHPNEAIPTTSKISKKHAGNTSQQKMQPRRKLYQTEPDTDPVENNKTKKKPKPAVKAVKKAGIKALPKTANSTKNVPSRPVEQMAKPKESTRKNAKEKATAETAAPATKPKKPTRAKKEQE